MYVFTPPARAAAAFTAAALVLALLCGIRAARAEEITSGQDFQRIEHGRYLVIAGDCAACHTSDPNKPMAGGRGIETPFGTVVAPNITPDPDTGIGNWSDAQFDAALRRGVRPDGKRLYPAMPYGYYTHMTADDIIAVRAYLNTLEPVHNIVHADTLPFPFSVRAVMQVWDAMFFTPGEYQRNAKQSLEWNQGAYLAEGAGHCGACHTPKNWLGGDKDKEWLQGYNLQGWFAPNITNDAAIGLGRWSVEDIVAYLKTGHNRFSAAGGPMGEEVQDSSSQWSPEDLHAIAVYLKNPNGDAVPAGTTNSASAANGNALSADDARMVAGAGIYSDLCSACHAPDGTGVPYMIPNLAGSPNVAQADPTTMVRVVLQGARSVATSEEPTDAMMPSYGWQLSDDEIAAVTTFVRNSWGHAAVPVTARQVHEQREHLQPGARE